MTVNDLERRNGLYFGLFHRIRVQCVVRQLLGLPQFQHLLLIVCDLRSAQLLNIYLGKQTLITRFDVDPEAVTQSIDDWLKGF